LELYLVFLFKKKINFSVLIFICMNKLQAMVHGGKCWDFWVHRDGNVVYFECYHSLLQLYSNDWDRSKTIYETWHLKYFIKEMSFHCQIAEVLSLLLVYNNCARWFHYDTYMKQFYLLM
jgi:hypothetical protein